MGSRAHASAEFGARYELRLDAGALWAVPQALSIGTARYDTFVGMWTTSSTPIFVGPEASPCWLRTTALFAKPGAATTAVGALVRRATGLLWIAGVLAALTSNVAQAQTRSVASRSAEGQSSIENEFHAAVGLYVTGAVLLPGGGITALVAFLDAVNCTPGPARPCDGSDGSLAALIVGLIALSIGGLALVVAIGLDVDAHSRQSALRARSVSLAPGPGQLGLAFALRF